MSRVLLLPLCLMLCCFLQACEQGSAQKQQKIGIVNINRLLVDSDCGRAAAKHIEGVQDSLREQLTSLQKEVDGATKLTEKEKKAREDTLQREAQMAYARMQAEQQNVNNILNDVLHRTVESYRKKKGYDMILYSDVVLSFAESVDVTSEIALEMNKEKVTFTAPAADEKTDVKAGEKTEDTKETMDEAKKGSDKVPAAPKQEKP